MQSAAPSPTISRRAVSRARARQLTRLRVGFFGGRVGRGLGRWRLTLVMVWRAVWRWCWRSAGNGYNRNRVEAITSGYDCARNGVVGGFSVWAGFGQGGACPNIAQYLLAMAHILENRAGQIRTRGYRSDFIIVCQGQNMINHPHARTRVRTLPSMVKVHFRQ